MWSHCCDYKQKKTQRAASGTTCFVFFAIFLLLSHLFMTHFIAMNQVLYRQKINETLAKTHPPQNVSVTSYRAPKQRKKKTGRNELQRLLKTV